MGGKLSALQGGEKTDRSNLRAIYRATGNIHDRVRLLWVRSKSFLYHRLSLNVLRETIDYINDPPLLLTCKDLQIFLFSLDSKQLFPYIKLRKTDGFSALQNSTYMGGDKVFLILSPVQFAAHIEGQIHYFGRRADKEGCGTIYDRVRDCVYIFGGKVYYSESQSVDVRGTEVFTPATRKFTPMADMRRGRSDFSSCWHLELVYLCGSGHNHVETFDPRSRAFADHSVIGNLSYRLHISAAVSDGNELILLSAWTAWREKDKKWVETERITDFIQRELFSNGCAVVRRGVMYFAARKGIIGVNLTPGRESMCVISEG